MYVCTLRSIRPFHFQGGDPPTFQPCCSPTTYYSICLFGVSTRGTDCTYLNGYSVSTPFSLLGLALISYLGMIAGYRYTTTVGCVQGRRCYAGRYGNCGITVVHVSIVAAVGAAPCCRLTLPANLWKGSKNSHWSLPRSTGSQRSCAVKTLLTQPWKLVCTSVRKCPCPKTLATLNTEAEAPLIRT